MNKQSLNVDATLIQAEMPDSPFANFGRMMQQVREASALPSTTNGEALRAEELGKAAQTCMTRAVGYLSELYRLTDERAVLDVMNGLVDLQSELNVPLSKIGDGLAKREG